jgi:peroxiredoxin
MKLVLTLLLAGVAAVQAQTPARRAPGFSLPDLDYKQYDLADYRGKVVVIDMIQTNCPMCIQLTEQLREIKSKYGEKLQVLTVVTLPDGPPSIRKFIADHHVSNPVLLDSGQMIGSYMKLTPQNPTMHFPHVFVIDKMGMIRRDLDEKSLTPAALVGAIEAALK